MEGTLWLYFNMISGCQVYGLRGRQGGGRGQSREGWAKGISYFWKKRKPSWTKKIILWDLLFHCHPGDQADAKEANSAGWSVWEAGDQQEDDQVSLLVSGLVWSGVKSVRIRNTLVWSLFSLFCGSPLPAQVCQGVGEDCQSKQLQWHRVRFDTRTIIPCTSFPSELHENNQLYSFPLRLSVLRRPSRWSKGDRRGHPASPLEVSLWESQLKKENIFCNKPEIFLWQSQAGKLEVTALCWNPAYTDLFAVAFGSCIRSDVYVGSDDDYLGSDYDYIGSDDAYVGSYGVMLYWMYLYCWMNIYRVCNVADNLYQQNEPGVVAIFSLKNPSFPE